MIIVPSYESSDIVKDDKYYRKLPSEDEVRREVGWIFNKRMHIREGNVEKPLRFLDLERCIVQGGDLRSKNQIIHMKVVEQFKKEKGKDAKVDGSDMKAMAKLSKLISVYVSDVHENQMLQIREQNELLEKKEIDENSPNLWKTPYDESQIAGPVSDVFVEMIDHKDVYCPKYHYNFSKVNQCIRDKELLFDVLEFNEAMKNVPNNLAQNLAIENSQLKQEVKILENKNEKLENEKQGLNNQLSDLTKRFDKLEINFDKLLKMNKKQNIKINQLTAIINGVQSVLDEDGNLDEEI